jgi:hypothetical protein
MSSNLGNLEYKHDRKRRPKDLLALYSQGEHHFKNYHAAFCGDKSELQPSDMTRHVKGLDANGDLALVYLGQRMELRR